MYGDELYNVDTRLIPSALEEVHKILHETRQLPEGREFIEFIYSHELNEIPGFLEHNIMEVI